MRGAALLSTDMAGAVRLPGEERRMRLVALVRRHGHYSPTEDADSP